jgi:hypothetical protein
MPTKAEWEISNHDVYYLHHEYRPAYLAQYHHCEAGSDNAVEVRPGGGMAFRGLRANP